jgi:hypothetical protein
VISYHNFAKESFSHNQAKEHTLLKSVPFMGLMTFSGSPDYQSKK